MSNFAFEEVPITLQDEDNTEITLRPLPLGRLRKVMKAWNASEELSDDDDGFELLVNCAGIAISGWFKDKFDVTLSSDGRLKEEYLEYLMDTLDLETIYKILEITSDIKLNDPKVMEALQAMALRQAMDGEA